MLCTNTIQQRRLSRAAGGLIVTSQYVYSLKIAYYDFLGIGHFFAHTDLDFMPHTLQSSTLYSNLALHVILAQVS